MSMPSQPSQRLPKGLPGCLKKRRLLNDPELRPEVCREYGKKFLALGWWQDALERARREGRSPGPGGGAAAQAEEVVADRPLVV